MQKECNINSVGRISTYKVEEQYNILNNLPESKPSKKITNSKKGLKAIKALVDLQKNHNVSWYKYLKERNINNLNDLALFYRGNKITFKEMFEKSDTMAKGMKNFGLVEGDEIGVCVSNTPELVYILLAANKIGVKVNLFGSEFDEEYLSKIIDGVSEKLMFISDDNYKNISEILKTKSINNIVVTSLNNSLLKDPKKSDEYEPKLRKYYYYEDKTKKIVEDMENAISLSDFFDISCKYNGKVEECGDLETDFLITYTSGSTKEGFPKAIIHKNRSLNVMGRFHDSELSGNPKILNLRGLAHIHPESNTNVITCISDNLMQGWSVALEPEYNKEMFLDYLILNKPNYLNATTSFLIEAAKQYLIDKKFHENGVGRKLPFLLATFAVGEGTRKGEEKFINKFLRESRAGSGVSIKGLKLPFTTLSIGGGDCEHGGIYYTLWKSLYEKLYKPILKKEEMGLLPVPYVVVTALKQDSEGTWVECDYNEKGIIVANSYSNFSGYKDNIEETRKILVKDNLGRMWVSCKVDGYIDKIGGVHVKGRTNELKKHQCECYEIDEIIEKDTKNILSTSTVEVDGNIISTIQFQPLAKINEEKVLNSIVERLKNTFSEEILNSMYIRIIPQRESFPLTSAGKRSMLQLEKWSIDNSIKLSNNVTKKQSDFQKVLKIKK